MLDVDTVSREDRFLYDGRRCAFTGISSYSGDSTGRKYDVKVRVSFEEGPSDHVYLDSLTYVYDHRIRVRDLVDIRRENGIVLRGTVVEIEPEEMQPYLVAGNGSSVWMAAHEFERFVRADAPERAYKTLTAVRARIDVLEAELTALKLTEEVLEGVYGV